MASRILGSVICSAPGKLLLTPQVGPAVQPIPGTRQHWLESNSNSCHQLSDQDDDEEVVVLDDAL